MRGPTRDKVLSASQPCQSGRKTVYHVRLSGLVSIAVASPIAQVAVLSILPGANHAVVSALLAEGVKVMTELLICHALRLAI